MPWSEKRLSKALTRREAVTKCYREHGVAKTKERFGISRQRIFQIVNERKEKKAP